MNYVYIVLGSWDCGDSEIVAVYAPGKGKEAHQHANRLRDDKSYDHVNVDVHQLRN
jgi:hypothetical protein